MSSCCAVLFMISSEDQVFLEYWIQLYVLKHSLALLSLEHSNTHSES